MSRCLRRAAVWVLVMGAVALGMAGGAAAAAPGMPDPTFGSGGGTVTAVGSAGARATAVTVQPDGGVVAGGESYDGHGGFPLTLVRYTAAGAVDGGFGSGGVATAPGLGLSGVAVAPGGGVVAVGYTSRAGRRQPELARFTAAGALDPAFGSGGLASDPVGDGDAAGRALAVLRDGSVLVASDAVHGGEPSIAVTRYRPDGRLDGAFGSGGTTYVSLPGRALTAAALAVDAQGRVVVAGTSYDPAGSSTAPLVARLSPGGAPDPGFGAGAPVVVPTGLTGAQARALALDPAGAAVVAVSGRAPLRPQLAAVRVSPDGSPDQSFGAAGVAVSQVAVGDAFPAGVAIDSTGAVVLAGTAGDGIHTQTVLQRLAPGGSLDLSLHMPAPLVSFPGSDGAAAALAIDPRGRLVAAGSAFVGDRQEFAVARYGG